MKSSSKYMLFALVLVFAFLTAACGAEGVTFTDLSSGSAASAGSGEGSSTSSDDSSSEGEGTVVGVVDEISETSITVDGTAYLITEDTEMKDEVVAGDTVKVEYFTDENSDLVAHEVELLEEEDDDDDDDSEGEVVGVVDEITETSITVDGVVYLITEETEMEDEVVAGDTVRVEYFTNGDGDLVAIEIELVDDDNTCGEGDDVGEDDDDDGEHDDDDGEHDDGEDDDCEESESASSSDHDDDGEDHDDGEHDDDDEHDDDEHEDDEHEDDEHDD